MARGLGIRTHQIGLGESIEQAAKRINRRGIVVKVRASDFTQPLGKMSAKANEFTKSLEASNARVIAFGASAAIIGGITTSFAQLVIQAAKVEKILTDINVVLNTTATNLEKFGNGLFKVARNTSQTLEVAAEAALEFSRQGLSMEETLKRTNDALILTRLTGMKAADAVKGLTAAVNGFADVGLTTTQIINKLAAVDVKFAVSADDLVNALARAGAVAQDAGVQFDQLIGAVTAAQQITARGGAVIGNSFKTIFTRIQRSSTLDRLQELGIAVRDIRGNTLPALTVLQNLSSAYDNLGVSTKAAVAEQVGGVFQINVLKAAIKDLNKETSLYSQATQTSASASNQAYEKNAILQKSLASIATQTLTTVRELTANLGELTIAPALKEFLSSANDVLGMFNKVFGEGEGETIGSEFAKGFARAVGSVLTGPGMFLTILVFGKLFAKAFKFAKDSIKDLLEIQNIKDKERAIQEAIVDAMSQNVDLQKQLVKLDGDQTKQEALVLKILKEQTAYLEKQRSIARSLAPGLRASGVQPNLTVGSKPTKSEGFIPNFSQVTPMDRQREREGAKKGGYIAGAISKINIPNLGEVVYNGNESVKKFPGMQQPAIMPPEKSRAGSQYKDSFMNKHGFNPYVSGGLIPNYALEAARIPGTNILKLPKAKMMVETSATQKKAGDVLPSKVTGWKTLEARISNLRKGGMARYGSSLDALESLGIDIIQRPFYFTNIDSQGKAKRLADKAQRKVPKKGFLIGSDGKKITKSDIGGAAFEKSLLKSKHQRVMLDKGYESTQGFKNATVDFISKGRLPIEAKHGSSDFQTNSLIAKSLRLTGDKYIEQFLNKHGMQGSAVSMSETKMKESMNILEKNKIKPSAESVGLYRLSHGLIPNFADDKVQPVKSISNIIDGDSIEADVLVGTQRVDHRLHGVDAVEKNQAYGTRATSIAKNFYNNQKGKIRLRDRRVQDGKAAYGRGLFKDQELARSLVEKGYGVPDAGYLNRSEYFKYQKIVDTAKRKGVGIWRDKTQKGRYRHPKAKFYLHQQGIVQDAERWSDITVGNTRFKKGNINLSNKKFKGYADGGKKFRYSGLIPNFADFRTREQKIQDVLRDPANKGIKFRGSNLGTMSIKSKNMFHQMYLESYVNKGLKSDYDMLVEMGYDPKQIQAARRHKQKGGKVIISSRGFIPNFADPLSDAVNREKSAGIPASMIRVGSSKELMNPANPMGLAVTNTRDEPLGVQQGIKAAKAKGVDPKTHGASSGFIPNFNESKNKNNDAITKSGMDLMGAMFALTTVTYALEGAIGEAESGFAKMTKVTNSLVMGTSQAVMIFSSMNDLSKNLSSKGGKMSSIFGKVAKGAGIFGAVLGAAIPVFNAVKENTTWLDSGLDTLRKSAQKTSKSIDALGNAMSSAEGIQETRTKLVELDASAMAGTYQGEMKRLKLNAELIKHQSELGNQAATLSKHLNLSGKEIELMTSGTAEGMKKLQEAMVEAQQSMAVQTSMSGFILGSKGGGLFGDDPDPLLANIQKLNLANMISSSVDPDKVDASYDTMLAKVNQGASQVNYARENVPLESKFFNDVERFVVPRIIDDFKKSIAESDLDITLKSQLNAALDGEESFEEIAKFLREQKEDVKNLQNKTKKQNEEAEVNLAFMRQISNARLDILAQIDLERSMREAALNQLKIIHNNMSQEAELHNKIQSSLGVYSKASEVQAEMATKQTKIDNDHAAKLVEINNNTIKAREDAIKKFLKTGSDNAGNTFSELMKPATISLPAGEGSVSGSHTREKIVTDQKESFPINLKKIQDKLTKAGHEDLSKKLQGIKAQKQANNALLEYLLSSKDNAVLQEKIKSLQSKELGIIAKEAPVRQMNLDQIQKEYENSVQNAESEKKLREAALKTVEKELNISKNTLVAAQLRVDEYKKIINPFSKIKDAMHEELDTTIKNGEISNETNKFKRAILNSNDYIAKQTQSMQVLMDTELTTELQSISAKRSRLAAEEESAHLQKLIVKKLQDKIALENEGIDKQIRDDQTTLGAKFKVNEKTGRNYFQQNAKKANSDLVNSATELSAQYAANVEAGLYLNEAFSTMNEESINFSIELQKAQARLQNNDFGKKALEKIALDNISMQGDVQAASAEVGHFRSQGNAIRTAESELKLARSQKEFNIQTNQGSLFMDSLAVKIAETNVSIQRFNETLAETTFDAVKDGFRGLVDNMVNGTESAGDAMLTFMGGIVKKIHGAFMDRAIDQLTSGIMSKFMPGANQMNQGGLVAKYSTGGATGSIPAMLTAGEVVVRKKIVDKLGKGSLDKINKDGSLEDLYNKPNEDSFDLLSENAVSAPSITRSENRGALDNYLARRSSQDEKTSQNERSVVGGEIINDFTNTLAKFMGGIIGLKNGGDPEKKEKNLSMSTTNILSGGGYALGAIGAGLLNQKDGSKNQGPAAPKKDKTLNTQSMLSLDSQDERMSGMSRSKNQYRQEYGKYLLDKYDHDIQQKNEKERRKAGLISSVAQIAVMGGMAYAGGKYQERKNKNAQLDPTTNQPKKSGDTNSKNHFPTNLLPDRSKGNADLADAETIRNSFHSTTVSNNHPVQGGSINQMQNSAVSSITNSASKNNNLITNSSNRFDSFTNNLLNTYNTTSSQNHNINLQNANVLNSGRYNYNRNSIFNDNGSKKIFGMSDGGKVFGPAGVDKVGPVMLDRGEYVIKASSVNKVEKQYPGFFEKLNSAKMNEGGLVESSSSVNKSESNVSNTSSNNVTVNINIASDGSTSVDGGGVSEQEFAGKIKQAVLSVISTEKRVGGMLRGK